MSPATELALPKGSWVVVTGANGFISSQIVDELLRQGYNVRGTVRAEKAWMKPFFTEKYGEGRFETAIVPSIVKEDAWDEAFKGVSGVVHVAFDMSLGQAPDVVVSGAVDSVLFALKAAAKQSSIKRFVLTSSSAACLLQIPDKEGIVVDKDTWNDYAVQGASDPQTPEHLKMVLTYMACKTQGEREAWKWLEQNEHQFVFNTVLPSMNLGPRIHPEIRSSTMFLTYMLLQGVDQALKMFPPEHYIDVRDCAKLHVIALLDPSVHDERIFGFAHPFRWTEVIAYLKKLKPDNDKLVQAPANEGRDLSEIKLKDRAEGLLKSFYGLDGWVGFEQSLEEGVESFEG